MFFKLTCPLPFIIMVNLVVLEYLLASIVTYQWCCIKYIVFMNSQTLSMFFLSPLYLNVTHIQISFIYVKNLIYESFANDCGSWLICVTSLDFLKKYPAICFRINYLLSPNLKLITNLWKTLYKRLSDWYQQRKKYYPSYRVWKQTPARAWFPWTFFCSPAMRSCEVFIYGGLGMFFEIICLFER